MRIFPAVAVFAIALSSLLLTARPARAYPQFQLSSGTQSCAQCHYSPAGFGLLTTWGHDEAADTISRGGEGAFLHGLWAPPSWLALGGDFRAAVVRNEDGGAGPAEVALFPMQAEIYARAALADAGLSLYVAGGARGVTRPQDSRLASRVESVISREHYAMWKPSATGPYVRIGRFYAPFGLRLVEHITYVRQFTGFGLYEETYNVSAGNVADDWELHVTAFTAPPASFPAPLQTVGRPGSGGAVYAEKRFASTAALGGQARVVVNAEERLMQGGAVGKVWVAEAKTLFLSELDVQRHAIKGGAAVNQLVGYLGLTSFPIKGLMVGVAVERYQEDLRVAATAHNALDLQFNLFPWAHCEIVALGRYQWIGSGDADGAGASLAMLQLHYYL